MDIEDFWLPLLGAKTRKKGFAHHDLQIILLGSTPEFRKQITKTRTIDFDKINSNGVMYWFENYFYEDEDQINVHYWAIENEDLHPILAQTIRPELFATTIFVLCVDATSMEGIYQDYENILELATNITYDIEWESKAFHEYLCKETSLELHLYIMRDKYLKYKDKRVALHEIFHSIDIFKNDFMEIKDFFDFLDYEHCVPEGFKKEFMKIGGYENVYDRIKFEQFYKLCTDNGRMSHINQSFIDRVIRHQDNDTQPDYSIPTINLAFPVILINNFIENREKTKKRKNYAAASLSVKEERYETLLALLQPFQKKYGVSIFSARKREDMDVLHKYFTYRCAEKDWHSELDNYSEHPVGDFHSQTVIPTGLRYRFNDSGENHAEEIIKFLTERKESNITVKRKMSAIRNDHFEAILQSELGCGRRGKRDTLTLCDDALGESSMNLKYELNVIHQVRKSLLEDPNWS